ncbi:MAG: hypothetical protein LBP54_07825 [Campylobacteraceae bacterium]|jgi:hypothetical protein|nr:hypothetical protein [Campylobacteraceae bacterium]
MNGNYYVKVTNINSNAAGIKSAFVKSNTVSVIVRQYGVNFYDDNLDLIKTIGVDAGLYDLSDLQSGYIWYAAESNLPTISYSITQSANFYALPDVHEIQNETQLYNIRNDLNGNYILINNISLTNETLNETSGWNPIGDSNNPFTGILNGNKHKVTDLFINNTIKAHVGFFGYIYGGTVKNLGIEASEKGVAEYSSNMGTNRDVGYIAGYISNGVITNCYSMGNIVSGRGTVHIGGIAGGVENTVISNCYTAGDITITGDWAAGRITAYAGNSTINNCYSTKNITITEGNQMYAGGTFINNCYSIGNISASGGMIVGGILGHNENSISTISNCAAINKNISGGSGNRIFGEEPSITALINNFADSDMLVNKETVSDSNVNRIGKTLAEFQSKSIYENAVNGDSLGGLGWKFGNDDDNPWVWGAFDDYLYPTLYYQTQRP